MVRNKKSNNEPLAIRSSMRLWKAFKENIKSVLISLDFILGLIISLIVFSFMMFSCVPDLDVHSIASTLLPIFIGVLATFVAFTFAGLIFLVSVPKDDDYYLHLADNNMKAYRIFLFHLRWIGFIGGIGILISLMTYLIQYMGLDVVTIVAFSICTFFFVYTTMAVMGLFGTFAVNGAIRLTYYRKNSN